MIKIDCQSCNNNPCEGDSYCRQCGEELPEQDTFECPECDAEIYEEDNFCFSCGTKFEGTQEDQESGELEQQVDAPLPIAPPKPLGQPQPIVPPAHPPQNPGFDRGF